MRSIVLLILICFTFTKSDILLEDVTLKLFEQWRNYFTEDFHAKSRIYSDSLLPWTNLYETTNVRSPHNHNLGRGINGGIPCATCTVLFSMASQLGEIHNETLIDSLQRFCGYLPVNYLDKCKYLVEILTPFILSELVDHSSPDSICYAIGICYVEPGRSMCHLFPLPEGWNHPNSIHQLKLSENQDSLKEVRDRLYSVFPWICYLPGLKQVCDALDNAYDKLVPGIDLDGDRHSPAETLRGSLWRGRDCSDLSAEIYPGRRPIDGDRFRDSNCNGIYGVNPDTGIPYEEELCAGSGQRGLIYIGDSVGAHFHVPPAWFTPSQLTTGIFANLSYVISNEADWPDVSFATGFRNATYMTPIIFDQNVDSIYLRLRERNRCNHRDYQNLARNGANSNDTLDYMKSISRNTDLDHPAIVLFALVGNDVCNELTDTTKYMTTPEKFYNNTMETLRFLNEVLPPESHVILMGLIDGSVIYKAMAKRLHPLGQLKGDLTYDDVYNWFNCMEIGPCQGWMTSNATLRHYTTRRANQLSKVLKKIAAQETFEKIDVHFVRNPFRKVIDDWLDAGGELWQIIEPVDSLHPTQKTQGLIAKELWKQIERRIPFVLGPENKNNDRIRCLFEDQGGH